MKTAIRLFQVLAAGAALALASCETLKDDHPKPERERISSMPHNMPQPWEGQAGLPGLAGGGY